MKTLKRPTTVAVTLVCLASLVLVTRSADAQPQAGTQRVANEQADGFLTPSSDRLAPQYPGAGGWTGNVGTLHAWSHERGRRRQRRSIRIDFYRELGGFATGCR